MKVQLNSGVVLMVPRARGLELISAKGGKEIFEKEKPVAPKAPTLTDKKSKKKSKK